MGFWQAMTQHGIQQILKMTRKCRTKPNKTHSTEWPGSMTFLEKWQRGQNLCSTQGVAFAQTTQMTAVGYISAMEEIVKASWSLSQHDGAAVFEQSEILPLPPVLSTKDLPGGRTQILNVRCIPRINRHPVESDEDCALEGIPDTELWLNWNVTWIIQMTPKTIARQTLNLI